MVKRGKQVKQRGKSSKKPLVKGKGSAKKRVSKRRSSKGKKTPMAHGRSEEIPELVNRYFPPLLTERVETAIKKSPYKEKYYALDASKKSSIRLKLEKKAANKIYQNLGSSELGKALDDELATL